MTETAIKMTKIDTTQRPARGSQHPSIITTVEIHSDKTQKSTSPDQGFLGRYMLTMNVNSALALFSFFIQLIR